MTKRHLKRIGGGLLVSLVASLASPEGLLPRTLPPEDYVLEKLARHRIVLLGEGHWIRHDAELVAALVARLAEGRIEGWRGRCPAPAGAPRE
jgi:hypothetical protein